MGKEGETFPPRRLYQTKKEGKAKMWRAWVFVMLLAWATFAFADKMAAQPSTITSLTWRVRVESWDFFDLGFAGVDNSYTFIASLLRAGINGKASQKQDWQLELAHVSFAGLPTEASAGAGTGALYRTANGGRDGSVFVKQAFWRWQDVAGKGSMLRLGRFEFFEGTELMPKDPTLSWLRRDRISHRLLGNFGWSHVQRSLDGLQFSLDRKSSNFTLLLARPTRGVFDLKGNDQLSKVTVLYGSWTSAFDDRSDGRLFALHYRDSRPVVKTSNTAGITGKVKVTTLGGHYLRTWDAGDGRADALLWGAWQFGDWGQLDHKANALALEAGYQWREAKWQPHLRVGYFVGSGDDNPNDNDHETFFQVLPTPRLYARTPIYNLMNNKDLFVQLMLKPTKRWSVRLDWHRLSLAKANDLWYAGGGAFNNTAFGYAGRQSGGQDRLMDLADVSIDYSPDAKTTWTLYVARAIGKGVVQSSFPAGKNATFLYFEWLQRW